MQRHATTSLALISTALFTGSLAPRSHAATVLTVDLGSASSFAILAGSGISIAAPADTVITGDIGSSPTPAITGLENATLHGTNHAGNEVTQAAKADLLLAYLDAAGRPQNESFGDGFVLTGTYVGGVYESAGSFTIDGILSLDAGGDSGTVWIFQSASTLEAASASQVLLINGALASNVFWQVGSSATLQTSADFSGTILADTSITLNTGVNLAGRALALNGAVTLGSVIISVPEPATPLLATLALLGFGIRRRPREPAEA